MVYLKSTILEQFSDIIFAFSTKIGLGRGEPYHFNISKSVGDSDELVDANRDELCRTLGIEFSQIAFQNQIHSDIVKIVKSPGNSGESDALITDIPGTALAVTSADCCAAFLFASKKKVIAAVHSGWRGTKKRIVEKTLDTLIEDFDVQPSEIYAYLAPSISQMNYEVGPEVSSKFEDKYLLEMNEKILLDVAGVNYDILQSMGVKSENIQQSNLCSFKNGNFLHSYRRDGAVSGRSWGIIMMRDNA